MMHSPLHPIIDRSGGELIATVTLFLATGSPSLDKELAALPGITIVGEPCRTQAEVLDQIGWVKPEALVLSSSLPGKETTFKNLVITLCRYYPATRLILLFSSPAPDLQQLKAQQESLGISAILEGKPSPERWLTAIKGGAEAAAAAVELIPLAVPPEPPKPKGLLATLKQRLLPGERDPARAAAPPAPTQGPSIAGPVSLNPIEPRTAEPPGRPVPVAEAPEAAEVAESAVAVTEAVPSVREASPPPWWLQHPGAWAPAPAESPPAELEPSAPPPAQALPDEPVQGPPAGPARVGGGAPSPTPTENEAPPTVPTAPVAPPLAEPPADEEPQTAEESRPKSRWQVLKQLPQRGPATPLVAAHRQRVVAFWSAKPGAGKSTLLVNAAAALSRRADLKLATVDLNLYNSSLAALLGQDDRLASFDLLFAGLEAGGLSQRQLEAAAVPLRPNWHLFSSESGRPDFAQALSLDRVQEFVELLRPHYDLILLDLSSRLADPPTRWALRWANQVLVLTGADYPEVADTCRYLQRLTQGELHRSRLELVVNRVPARGLREQADIEEAAGLRVAVQVPVAFEALHLAASEGRPAFEGGPAAFVAATEALADLIYPLPRRSGKNLISLPWRGRR